MTGSHETERTPNLPGVDGQEDRMSCPQRKRSEKSGPLLAIALLWGIFLIVEGCTSATNFSGATAALPTGQTGSISPLVAAPGNCYIPDGTTACSSSYYTGTSGITAVAAVTYGSTNALFLGDQNGHIYDATVSSAPPSSITCLSGAGSPILSLALIPDNTTPSPGTLFYSTSGGVSTETVSSSLSCTSSGTPTGIASSLLTYSGATAQVIGVTTTGSSFTCKAATTCTSPTGLPNVKGSTVTAIAADPKYPVVYVATSANGSYAIDIYSVSGSTLSHLGSYTGGELSAPTGIAAFHGPNPAQNYCTQTTGGCNFLDIANAGDDAITQYVLTYTGPPNAPTGVSLNQFNAAYMGCDLFRPSSLASIADPSTGAPAIFMGEDGTSLGPCMGVSTGTFGNNVTAYTAKNE